ncbi:hypothetical protein JMJ55_17655 [Belnapia sp. T6]|uniref:Uncharacterized protein n=1 Tax=Belnapia mucosa TaxID=2804532 RepID=A0ABS1V653_9PROT|nr:hypothetical protein [Belnapia mucosa]MBL6457165.1 hypothetical protein [Belnapia mucosa]
MNIRPSLLLVLLPLAACNDFDRPGTWRATGANDANLKAMLAEPRHAIAGAAARTERGQPGSQAIRLLETDRRRPLPDSRAAKVGMAPPMAPPAPLPGAGDAR